MLPVERPETRYAWNGDVALAYQLLGTGAIDLVYLQGYCSHVDMNWESPYLARFLRGLADLARLVIMDRRGWGCSDRFSPSDVPPLETLTDDLLVVMDAAGSKRAAVFATWEATPVALLFAAAYPERVAALILSDTYVRYTASDEMPWLPTLADWQEVFENVRSDWGTPRWAGEESALDERESDWYVRYQRASVSPGAGIAEFRRWLATDVQGVLPAIHVPTLVFAETEGDKFNPPETGRYIADQIPEAKFIAQSSEGGPHWHHWYGRSDAIVQEIGRFLAGLREEEASLDRFLVTVLFTDIANSATKAASLGDRGWREVVERHHATIRALLARFKGVEVDTAGDGFFATFEGPARAVRCAQAISEAVRPIGIEIRVGIHTGECELIGGKAGGLAVVIGARIGAMASPSEVLVSQTVKDLVAGSGLVFEDRGEHVLKGVPGRWRVYAAS
jgi:class 3 adenylate cyclase